MQRERNAAGGVSAGVLEFDLHTTLYGSNAAGKAAGEKCCWGREFFLYCPFLCVAVASQQPTAV